MNVPTPNPGLQRALLTKWALMVEKEGDFSFRDRQPDGEGVSQDTRGLKKVSNEIVSMVESIALWMGREENRFSKLSHSMICMLDFLANHEMDPVEFEAIRQLLLQAQAQPGFSFLKQRLCLIELAYMDRSIQARAPSIDLGSYQEPGSMASFLRSIDAFKRELLIQRVVPYLVGIQREEAIAIIQMAATLSEEELNERMVCHLAQLLQGLARDSFDVVSCFQRMSEDHRKEWVQTVSSFLDLPMHPLQKKQVVCCMTFLPKESWSSSVFLGVVSLFQTLDEASASFIIEAMKQLSYKIVAVVDIQELHAVFTECQDLDFITYAFHVFDVFLQEEKTAFTFGEVIRLFHRLEHKKQGFDITKAWRAIPQEQKTLDVFKSVFLLFGMNALYKQNNDLFGSIQCIATRQRALVVKKILIWIMQCKIDPSFLFPRIADVMLLLADRDESSLQEFARILSLDPLVLLQIDLFSYLAHEYPQWIEGVVRSVTISSKKERRLADPTSVSKLVIHELLKRSTKSDLWPDMIQIKEDPYVRKAEALFHQFRLQEQKKEYSIPPLIHLIWLGSPPPVHVQLAVQSWKKHHPSWEVKLWTDREIESFSFVFPYSEELFLGACNFAEKSDVLRWEILYQFGGIYADTDVICLKSFDPLVQRDIRFFAGFESDEIIALHRDYISMGSALVGSSRENVILQGMIHDSKNRALFKANDKHESEFEQVLRMGPGPLSRAIHRALDEKQNQLLILPSGCFYPILGRQLMTVKDIFSSVKDKSFAVHLWELSWV